ncbi:hypothetical protein [Microvirga guangxiensis]|uniref:Uncharacterized protein n=1 Tax=Microvirga guangxiensis TaxID=549386 RepID=A0A1G5KJI7_9HYPH|nr:hypothetical protein [Microvirga guangxiensis]SCZ00109.1 hypothetical protein SAMN02927923_03326 [Microvirga guangxiensis]
MTDHSHDDEQAKSKSEASTPQLDRLEKLANAAATASQEKHWRARKSGMQLDEQSSEVRDLSQDAEARAQAEDALKRMMAKPQSGRRR